MKIPTFFSFLSNLSNFSEEIFFFRPMVSQIVISRKNGKNISFFSTLPPFLVLAFSFNGKNGGVGKEKGKGKERGNNIRWME